MAKERLEVELVAQAQQAISELQKYVKATGQATKQIETHAKQAQKTGERIGALTKAVKSYFAEITAAIAIGKKFFDFLSSSAQAYMDQEDAVTRLDSALRNTGIYTADVSNRMQTLAGNLQKVTTYGDETTLAAMGIFQSFAKLNEDGISKTIPLVQDLAARLGMDLNNAAMLVGKAIGSGTNALGRYGLEMETGSSKTERLTQVMAWLKSGFEGTAEAMGTTYSGRLKIIKNLMDEYKETLGKFILEGGTPFLTWLGDVLKREAGMQGMANTIRVFGATFFAVFKISADIIQAFMNYVMATTRSIDVLGSVAARVMSGGLFSKEGREGIKKDLQYLGDLWTEYGKAVGNAFKTDVGKIIDAYSNSFKKLEPGIKTTGEAVTDFSDTASSDLQKVEINLNRTRDAIIEIAMAQRAAAQAPIGFGAQAVGPDMEAQVEGLRMATEAQALYGREVIGVTEKMGALQTAFQSYYMTSQEISAFMASTFTDQMISGFDAIMSGSKDLKEGLKDMIAGFLQALGKMFFVQFLANLFLRPRKAFSALAASVAAYAGAAVVRSLQQGGTVKRQVGGSMYGDRQPAMLEQGERVIPRVTAAKNAAALNRMEAGEGGGAPVNVYIGGKLLYSTMQRAFRNGQIVVDARAIR